MADLSLEGRTRKKLVESAFRRMIANYSKESYQMSKRRACRLISLPLKSLRYQAKSKASDELAKLQVINLAKANIRYSYRRLGVCLAVGDLVMNHKKVYRLYKEVNLALSRKKSKKLKQQRKVPMKAANCFNEYWFSPLSEAQTIWQNHYNNRRHHSSLGYLTPKEFIKKNSCDKLSLKVA